MINKHLYSNGNVSFKGYFACPLKAVYVQPSPLMRDEEELSLLQGYQKDLNKEGVDLYFQLEKMALQNNPKSYLTTDINQAFKDRSGPSERYSPWGQDNKFIVNTPNGLVVLENGIIRKREKNAVKELAESLGGEYKKMISRLDGGNVFLGKTDEKKKFALVGDEAIEDTALKMALAKKDFHIEFIKAAGSGKVLIKFGDEEYCESLKNLKNNNLEKMDIPNLEIKEILSSACEDYKTNKSTYFKEAKTQIFKDLNIQDVRFIEQPAFHIDMIMRPLKYPYVLVNDYNLSVKCLEEEKSKTISVTAQNDIDKLISETTSFEMQQRKMYPGRENVAENLEKLGFNVIKVPAVFGISNNFMNAVVHENNENKLAYFTNKSSYDGNLHEFDLNKMYENYLSNIDTPNKFNFYFEGGADEKESKTNQITDLISSESGALHCISNEVPID